MFLILLVLQLCRTTYASPDFVKCLERLQNQEFGQVVEGAVDANGYSVSNVTLAVGLTYPACINLCGSGNEAFNMNSFSQQLVTWLLPWLALISQLPYGSNDVLKNFESMLLTVGSPMLAGYSLALAVTSNRWMVDRFGRSNYPNSILAAKVVSSLQQVLFSLPKEDHVLWSLVVLRENDEWWWRLANGLDYSSSRWTLAAIMSMVYVGLTYILTWMTTFDNQSDQAAWPGGQSLGSLWLSLLPLVVCYLQLSPKSDVDRINAALDHANELCFFSEENGEATQRRAPQTITVQTACRSIVDEDRICSTPVCFYARFHAWFQIALQLSNAFDTASQRSRMGGMVPSTRPEIVETDGDADDRYHYDLVNIYVKSAMLAIFLQWGTTGAAVMAMYLTPTIGLGCFSGSLLLYGCVSTLIWLCLVVSGVLAHAASQNTRLRRFRVFGGLAVALRHTGKLLAAINTAWVFASAFLQFSNAESNCYCKAAALGLGNQAYAILGEVPAAKRYWAGGVIMASGTALAFIIAINILRKQPVERRIIHRGYAMGYEHIPLTAQQTS